MKNTPLLAFLTCSAALLGACSSTPVAPAKAPAPVANAAAPAPAPAPAQTASTNTAAAVPAYLDPNNPVSSQRSVYFGFDDFTIKADQQHVVDLQGKFLAAHPEVAVKVEGNADERGSAEYNLALGQKRADAVVAGLKVFGVKPAQMEAISWGKEKPRATGHDEAAWSQNRRVDVVYPSK